MPTDVVQMMPTKDLWALFAEKTVDCCMVTVLKIEVSDYLLIVVFVFVWRTYYAF